MKKRNHSALGLAVVLAAFCFFGCSSNGSNAGSANGPASSPAASASKSGGLLSRIEGPKPVTIPAGTDIHVTLGSTISSGTSNSGDSFDGTLSEPVVSGGKVVIPRDARVRGTVVEARPSGRLSKPALLSVALTSVEVGGSWAALHSHSITLEGKSHKKRDLIAIGGGSALGALIGGLAGGGKGAAIGAGAGAGAGTAGAALTGKKEISLPVESHLTFRLSEPLTVKVK